MRKGQKSFLPPSEPVAKSNRAGIRQADVARAVRGALQAGMDVREVIASKDCIRILCGSSASASSTNSWDEVLNDG